MKETPEEPVDQEPQEDPVDEGPADNIWERIGQASAHPDDDGEGDSEPEQDILNGLSQRKITDFFRK